MRNANTIAIRTSLLVRLAMGLRLVCLVEQPDHPRGLVAMQRWQELARRHVLYKSKCVQGSYGAPTKKPTSLYSNHTKFVLCNKLSTEDQARIRWTNKQLVTRKRLADGRLRVTGNTIHTQKHTSLHPGVRPSHCTCMANALRSSSTWKKYV